MILTGPKSTGDVRGDRLKNLVELFEELREKRARVVAHEIYSSFGAKRTPRTAQTDKTA